MGATTFVERHPISSMVSNKKYGLQRDELGEVVPVQGLRKRSAGDTCYTGVQERFRMGLNANHQLDAVQAESLVRLVLLGAR
jgi:hypothetical protein